MKKSSEILMVVRRSQLYLQSIFFSQTKEYLPNYICSPFCSDYQTTSSKSFFVAFETEWWTLGDSRFFIMARRIHAWLNQMVHLSRARKGDASEGCLSIRAIHGVGSYVSCVAEIATPQFPSTSSILRHERGFRWSYLRFERNQPLSQVLYKEFRINFHFPFPFSISRFPPTKNGLYSIGKRKFGPGIN